MARTLEAIDRDLREAVARRKKTRADLSDSRTPKAQRDTLMVREGLCTEQIERYLEERSLLMFAAQISSL